MSDVIVSTNDPITTVTTTDNLVEIAITNNPVEVSASTAGVQGASYNQGDPIYVTVRNATGATLPKGTIVYLSGANGNHVQVTPAIATSDATSARTLGWLAEAIANNASGLCQIEGYLEGLNTQGLTAGNQLYLSGTTAGAFTATKPQAPIHLVYVGVVSKVSAGDGHVFVKVQNGYELEELHDVQIISPVNNQVLTYDSATDLWKNATNPADGVTSITATAPLTGGTITSTGSIGLDQTALSITQSQVSGLVSDLAGKANLAGGNALTGAQTITSTASGEFPLSIISASGQTASTFRVRNSANNADLMSIDSSGQIRTSTILNPNSFNNSRLQMQNTGVFIDTGVTTNVPLAVRGSSGQTANLQVWQDNAGTVLGSVGAAGQIRTAASIRNITMDAVVAQLSLQASSATNPVAILRGAASQSANLQEWQDSAGTILGRVNNIGEIVTSTTVYANNIQNNTSFWSINNNGMASFTARNATNIPMTITGASAQTADLLLLRNNGLTTQFRVDPNGMTIANSLGVAGSPSGISYAYFTTPAPAAVPVVIRGAASQTADLLEVQNSSGTDLLSINASGGLVVGTTHLPGASPGLGQIRTSTNTGLNYVDTTANDAANTGPGYTARRSRGTLTTPTQVQANDLLFGIFAQGYNNASGFSGNSAAVRMLANENFTTTGVGSSIVFETASDGTTGRLERMRVTGSGTLSVGTTAVTGQLGVVSADAARVGQIIRGAASQSANLLEVQNSASSVIMSITSSGNVRATNGLLTNGIQGQDTLTAITVSNGRGITIGTGSAIQGGGAGVIGIANAGTVPTSNPSGGGILYVEAGALKFRGSSGTITTIANA